MAAIGLPLRDYIQLHLIILAWGLTAILGKLICLPPLDLVIWRTGIAAVGFVLLARLLGVKFMVSRRERFVLLGLGLLIGWHWILFFLSARLATASVCLAAMPTIMIVCSLIEPLVDGTRRWRISELVVGLVICCAVWMIYEVELRYWLGLTVGLVSVLFAASFAVGNKRIAHRHHFSVLMGWQMIGGCLACLVVRPFFEPGLLPIVPHGDDVGWLLVLALVCTVATYAGYADLLRRMSVFTINIAYNMEPVYGIVLAAVVFGDREHMSTGFYVAATIIILSVVALPLWNRRSSTFPVD